ncbi:hypothetical protein D3C77_591420 [compost metagenome]
MHRRFALNEVILALNGVHIVGIRIEGSQLGQFIDDRKRFYEFRIGKLRLFLQHARQEITARKAIANDGDIGGLKRPLLFVP